MNKTDLILKKAKIFERMSIFGQADPNTGLHDYYKSVGDFSTEESGYPSADPNSGDEVESKPAPKLQDPYSLKSKKEVEDFQRRMSYYAKANPEFNNMLTKALGGKAWDLNTDVDGIKGPRTMKAWNLYKQYAGAASPGVDISKKHEEITSVGAKLLNEFRNKLRTLRQQIATNTNNFQNRHNIGADKVKAAWLPFLQKEYGQLSAGYTQFPPEMKKEFTNLAQYMQSLFGAYMKAPPAEPRSLIDIDSYVYTPEGI